MTCNLRAQAGVTDQEGGALKIELKALQIVLAVNSRAYQIAQADMYMLSLLNRAQEVDDWILSRERPELQA